MSNTGKMTKKLSRVLISVSAVLLVGAIVTACAVAGLFNMPSVEVPGIEAPVESETPIVDNPLGGTVADNNVEIPEIPELKEEDKIKPNYDTSGAGRPNVPTLNPMYNQYDGYGVYSWNQLNSMIRNLKAGQSATYVVGVDLVADSTIIVPTGANVTISSITNLEGDRKKVTRKIKKTTDGTDTIILPSSDTGNYPDNSEFPNIQTRIRDTSFTGSMFYVSSGATLSIQHLELNGGADQFVTKAGAGVYECYALVMLAPKLEGEERNALFNMEDGAILTKNKQKNNDKIGIGGGVFVNAGATFIMNGGEISYMTYRDWTGVCPTAANGVLGNAADGGSVFVGRENVTLYQGKKAAGEYYGEFGALPGVGYGEFFFYGGNITRSVAYRSPTIAFAGLLVWDGGRTSYCSSQGRHFYGLSSDSSADYCNKLDTPASKMGSRLYIYSGEFDNHTLGGTDASMMFLMGDSNIYNIDMHDNIAARCIRSTSDNADANSPVVNVYGGDFYNNTCSNMLFYANGKATSYAAINIYDVNMHDNKVAKGGGLQTEYGDIVMYGGKLYDNTTALGAIRIANGTATIYGGEFNNNINSSGDGGAVNVASGSFTMYGGSFDKNSAKNNGGAVYVTGGDFTMYGGSFTNNKAGGQGGAAYISGGNFMMTGGSFIHNVAVSYPGFYCNKSVYLGGDIQIQHNLTTAGVEQNLYLATEAATVTIVKPLDEAYISISKSIPSSGSTIVAQGASQATGGIQATDEYGAKMYTNNETKKTVYYDGTYWYYSVAEGPIYKNAAGDEIYQKGGKWYKCGTTTLATLAVTSGVTETPTKKTFTVGTTASAAYVTAVYQEYHLQTFDALCCYSDVEGDYLFEVNTQNQIVLRPAKGHEHAFEDYTVEPSCDRQGYTMHVCPGDHALENWTEKDFENGLIEIEELIGSLRVTYTAPKGHRFVWNEDEECFICHEAWRKPTGEYEICNQRVYIEFDDLAASYPYTGSEIKPSVTGKLYQVDETGKRTIYAVINDEFYTAAYENNTSIGTATVKVQFTAAKSLVSYRNIYHTIPTGPNQGKNANKRYSYSDRFVGTYSINYEIAKSNLVVTMTKPNMPIGQNNWFTDDTNVFFGGLQTTTTIVGGTVAVDGHWEWWDDELGDYTNKWPALKEGTNQYVWKFVPNSNWEIEPAGGSIEISDVVLLQPMKLTVNRTDGFETTFYNNNTWDQIKAVFDVQVTFNKGANATGNDIILGKDAYTIRLHDKTKDIYYDGVTSGLYYFEFTYTLNGKTVTAESGSRYNIVPVAMTNLEAEVTQGKIVYDSVASLDELRDYLTVRGIMSNDTKMDIGKDDYELVLMSGTWGGAGTYSLRATYTNDNNTSAQTVFSVTVYANSVASMSAEWKQNDIMYTSTKVNKINDFGDLTVTVKYLDGTTKVVPMLKGGTNGYTASISSDELAVGNNTVTLTYAEANANGIVSTVRTTIEVTADPVEITGIKYELKEGEKFFTTDEAEGVRKVSLKIIVSLLRNDGSTLSVPLNDEWEELQDPGYNDGDPYYFFVYDYSAIRRDPEGACNLVIRVMDKDDQKVVEDGVYRIVPVVPTVQGIEVTSAANEPGNKNSTIYTTNSLDDLKYFLTVETVRDDGVRTTVFSATNRNSSVTLSLPAGQEGFNIGANTVTVEYTDAKGNSFTTTITVNAIGVDLQNVHVYVKQPDAGNGETFDYGTGNTKDGDFQIKDNVIFTSHSVDDVKNFIVVRGFYADGSEFEFDITQYTLTGLTTLTAGTVGLTANVVDDKGNTVSRSFNIKVTAVKLDSIAATFTQNDKVIYANTGINDVMDCISVEATYNDGSKKTFSNGFTASIAGGKFSESGANTINVAYQGKTAAITEGITVTAKAYDSLTYTATQGNATIYASATGSKIAQYLMVYVNYNDGTRELLSYDVNGGAGKYTLDMDLANSEITVKYEVSATETAELDVTLNITQLTVTAIKSVTPETVTGFYASSGLNDLKNYITVTATYNDGEDRVLSAEDYQLTMDAGETLDPGSTKTITVKVGTKRAWFDVEIANYSIDGIKSVTLTQNETVIYASKPISELKQYIHIVVELDGNGGEQTLDGTDYTLSGDLTKNELYITLSINGQPVKYTMGTSLVDIEDAEGVRAVIPALVITQVVPTTLTATYNQGTAKILVGASITEFVPYLTVDVVYNDGTNKTLGLENKEAGTEGYMINVASGEGYENNDASQEGNVWYSVTYTKNGETVTDYFQAYLTNSEVNASEIIFDQSKMPNGGAIYASSAFNNDGTVNYVLLKTMLSDYLTLNLIRNNGNKAPWQYELYCDMSAAELAAIRHYGDIEGKGGKLTLQVIPDNYETLVKTIDLVITEVASTDVTATLKPGTTIYSSDSLETIANALNVTVDFNDGTEETPVYNVASSNYYYTLAIKSGTMSMGGKVVVTVTYGEKDIDPATGTPVQNHGNDVVIKYQRCEVELNVVKVVPVSLTAELKTGAEKVDIYASSTDAVVRSALLVKATYNNSEVPVTLSAEDYTLDTYTLVEGTTVTLTVKYTNSDITVSDTVDITVSSTTVSSIKVDISGLTGKTIYTSQNKDDLSQYITVTGKVGASELEIENYTLSHGENAWKAGLVTITVTYNNGTTDLTTTFQVNLVAYSLSSTAISFDTDDLTVYSDYKFSDIKAELESRLSVVGTWTDGNNHANEHVFGTPVASGVDGGATFTVAYTVDGKNKTETVNLALETLKVTGMEIKANDTYTLYTSQSASEVEKVTKLYVVYNSGNKSEVSWTAYTHHINASGWANGGSVVVNASVNYVNGDESAVYNPSVTLTVTKVELSSLTITYALGEDETIYTTSSYNDILSKGTLTVKGVNNDGSEIEITSITAANLSGTLKSGATTLTVTYNDGSKDVTGTFTVTVEAVTVESFEVEYNFDDAKVYSTTNITSLTQYITSVKLVYSDSSETVLNYDVTETTGYWIEGDLTKVTDGKSTVKVKYSDGDDNYEESIDVTITPAELLKITASWVVTDASKEFYKNGGLKAITDSGYLTVVARYQTGENPTDVSDATLTEGYTVAVAVTGDNPTAEIPDGGVVVIEVSYTENGVTKTDDFEVTITAKAAESISAKYELNENAAIYTTTELSELESKGTLTISVVYNDGSEEQVVNSEAETRYVLSGDLSSVGTKNVTVMYGRYTGTLEGGAEDKESNFAAEYATTFEVDVNEVKLTAMEAKWKSEKAVEDVYPTTNVEALNKMMTVIAKYNDGKTADVTLMGSQYSLAYNFAVKGAETTITITGVSVSVGGVIHDISDLSATLTANVKENSIVGMEATYSVANVYTSTTVADIYADTANLTVNFIYADGTKRPAGIKDFRLTGDLTEAGDVSITVEYIDDESRWDADVEDKTCTFTVAVEQVIVEESSVEFEYDGDVVVFDDTDKDDIAEAIIAGISESGAITFNDGKTHGYAFEVTNLEWNLNGENSLIWDITAAITVTSTRTYWDNTLQQDVTVADSVFPAHDTYTFTFSIEISYKVTYNNVDADDEAYKNTNKATYKVSDGNFELSDAERAGYHFDGWYSDAAFGTEVTEIDVTAGGDRAVYAKWSLDKPTLEFKTTEHAYNGEAQEFELTVTNKNANLFYSYVWYTYVDGAENDELISGVTGATYSLTNVADSVKVRVVVTVADSEDAGIAITDYSEIVMDLTITVAVNTVSIEIEDWTYGGDASEPTATVKFGDAANVTYKYFTDPYCSEGSMVVNGDSEPIVPSVVGTYYVRGYSFADAEDGNYEAGVSETKEFKIVAKAVTVPTVGSKVYTAETLVAEIEDGEYYTVMTNDGGIGVASYDVVLLLSDMANTKWAETEGAVIDEAAGTATIKFAITQAENVITVAMDGFTYGGTPSVATVTVKFGDEADVVYVYSSSLTGTYQEVDLTTLDAGTYYVKATLAGTDDYADGESEAVSFVIAKAAGSIAITTAIAELGWTYGTAATTPECNKNSDGAVSFVYSAELLGEYTAEVPANAGTYYVKAVLGETKNYLGSESAAVQFVIAKAQNEITKFTFNDWIEGKPASVPVLVAKDAKSGERVIYTYADEEYGAYTSTVPTTPGKHYIKVVIPESDNYLAVSETRYHFWINKESAEQKNENGETDIKVNRPTGMNPDAEVTVDPIGDKELGEIEVPGNEVLGGFEINITGDEQGLNLPMTVTKLIPEELRGRENLKVYAVKADGSKVDCKAKISSDGKYLVFTTVAGCSKYVITEEIPEVAGEPVALIACVAVFGVLAAAMVVLAVVIFLKKRNKEEENA